MRHESMAPWNPGRRPFRFLWLLASALAVLASGCGARDEVPPSGAGPDSEPVGSKPRSDQGAFVGAGGRIKSSKYVMDFVLGQSTQNQDQSTSKSYVARGGLIGGNGRTR